VDAAQKSNMLLLCTTCGALIEQFFLRSGLTGCRFDVLNDIYHVKVLLSFPCRHSSNIEIIIIIINKTMFMVLSSWQNHCESSPGSFDECRMTPSGRRPKTRPNDLGCDRLYRLPESTPTITIYYYYSTRKLILILPSHRG